MSSFDIISVEPLSCFSEVAFANRHRIRRMTLITPWVGEPRAKYDFLSLLIEASSGPAKPVVFLLTRPPREPWHARALEILGANVRPLVVLFNASLHAKLYLMQCDGFHYALLGSPNLTGRANTTNLELAIEFRSSYEGRVDKVSTMIRELVSYADALLADEGSELARD